MSRFIMKWESIIMGGDGMTSSAPVIGSIPGLDAIDCRCWIPAGGTSLVPIASSLPLLLVVIVLTVSLVLLLLLLLLVIVTIVVVSSPSAGYFRGEGLQPDYRARPLEAGGPGHYGALVESISNGPLLQLTG